MIKASLKSAAIAASLSITALLGTAVVAAGPSASEWAIGPIIKGRNFSVGMPLTMQPGPRGPFFEFPYPKAADGHVHYVTAPIDSLAGARRITLRYRIDAAPGVRFIPQEHPGERAYLSLYFQRVGDRWTVRTPHHRWYAPNDRIMPLSPGTHTASIPLDAKWIAMMGGDASTLPGPFAAAKQQAAEVGFVFGSPSGRGHGVFATGPARFTVLDFEIE